MTRKIILPDDTIQQIKQMFVDGKGMPEIAKTIGCSRDIIRRLAKEYQLVKTTNRIPDYLYYSIIQMLNIGLTYREIGLKLGYEKSIVKRFVRNSDFVREQKFSQKIILPEDVVEQVKTLFNQGFGALVIGKKLGYKKDVVKKCIKENNIIRDLNFKPKFNFNLRHTVRQLAKSAVYRSIDKQKDSISNYVPYNAMQLKKHLESLFEPWMNWDNYGPYRKKEWDDNDPTTWKWQIDHIIPHSILPYNSMHDENFQKSWALSNLRPYSAKQNLIDGAKRSRH